MKDHAYTDRQAFIAGTRTPEQKLRDALDVLGDRYLCSAKNRVPRCPHRQPESTKTDVRRTFARIRKTQGLDLA